LEQHDFLNARAHLRVIHEHQQHLAAVVEQLNQTMARVVALTEDKKEKEKDKEKDKEKESKARRSTWISPTPTHQTSTVAPAGSNGLATTFSSYQHYSYGLGSPAPRPRPVPLQPLYSPTLQTPRTSRTQNYATAVASHHPPYSPSRYSSNAALVRASSSHAAGSAYVNAHSRPTQRS